jgi:hypothetical protein
MKYVKYSPKTVPPAPGKIILLCGTSTAGKTSICTAAQTEANRIGHIWIVDGADVASEKAWIEPSEAGGKKYPSAQNYFVNAMKTHVDPSVVDAAVSVFGARTLAVALFSRRNLGNPKVDQVDLTPETNIKTQAQRIYQALSPENKAQYTSEGVENLLKIIRGCPNTEEFFKLYPYPPLQQLNEHMLERAITRAKKGESTILDVIGNETLDGQRMIDQFQVRLMDAKLPGKTGMIVLAHCPVNTLMDRINVRNKKAIAEGRAEEARLSFFPFDQYGAIYEKAPAIPDPKKPVVGVVTRQDIIMAANQFGRGSQDAEPLLDKLGFSADEKSVPVISKIQCDLTFQTGELTSQKIAECLCENAFGKGPASTQTAESKVTIQSSRERGSMASSAFFGRKAGKNPEADEPHHRASTTSSRAKQRVKYTNTDLTPWKF